VVIPRQREWSNRGKGLCMPGAGDGIATRVGEIELTRI
jgi:hypothetical protein